ncbi:MAG: substrate-binding domain-containing protein [Methylobacterium frigidaeris]
MPKSLLWVAVAALMLGPVAARAEGTPAGYPADYAKLIETSKSEQGVLVYSVMAAFNWKPVIEGFAKKYPWIKVETLDMSSELWDRYNTEKASGARTADLIASFGVDRWNEFIAKGEAVPHASPEEAHLPAWARLSPGVYGLSADPVLIVWNKRLVPEGTKLDSMAAVAKFAEANAQKVKGRLTTYDSGSGTVNASFNWLWSTMHPDAWTTLQALAPATKFERSGGSMLEKVTSGEYTAAYLTSAITVYTKINEPARKAILDWSYVKDGQPMFVRAMAVAKGGRNPASARLLMDHILSKDGQIAFAKGGLTPVRDDIAAGEIPYGTIAQVAEAVGGADKLRFMPYDEASVASITGFVERWKRDVATGGRP